MELPYVVIYSTYPGASAEKVETSPDPDFGILGQHDRKPVEYEFDFFG